MDDYLLSALLGIIEGLTGISSCQHRLRICASPSRSSDLISPMAMEDVRYRHPIRRDPLSADLFPCENCEVHFDISEGENVATAPR